MEIWKDIKGYEGLYQVSSLGNIRSLRFNKIKLLSKRKTRLNYYTIGLIKNNIPRQLRVHRLVGQAFLGLDITNKKICVCHKDDNPNNNKLSNLFLGTHKDNSQDMVKKQRNGNQYKKNLT